MVTADHLGRFSSAALGLALLGLLVGPVQATPQTGPAPTPAGPSREEQSTSTAPSFFSISGFISGRTYTILYIGGLATALLWDVGDPQQVSRDLNNSFLEPLMDPGNFYGSGWVTGGGSLVLLATGTVSGSRPLTTLGEDLCKSFLLGGALSGLIKLSVDRRRPLGGHLSFPSGHTTSAFATVPVLAQHLGWYGALPALGLATATALGRLEDKRHYVSDVVFGAALGLAVGDLVARQRGERNILQTITITPSGVGLALQF
jgi:membrane-associated phospholipid phosphatase